MDSRAADKETDKISYDQPLSPGEIWQICEETDKKENLFANMKQVMTNRRNRPVDPPQKQKSRLQNIGLQLKLSGKFVNGYIARRMMQSGHCALTARPLPRHRYRSQHSGRRS